MSSSVLERRRHGPVVLQPQGDQGAAVPGAGALGMGVFVASLSVLFVASLVAYFAVRLRSPFWPPADAPGLPQALWLSTLLLLACSAAIHLALHAIRRGDQARLLGWLRVTIGLAMAFLICQVWSWLGFFHAATFYRHLYGFSFYMLTGLHAAHVLGGLIALAVVTARAARGTYSWAHYPDVRNAAIYWHFLDGVWLLLFGSLLATS